MRMRKYLLTITASALCLPAAPSLAAAKSAGADSDWHFALTPYLWLAGISGTTAIDGVEPPPIDNDTSFFSPKNLDLAAFMNFSGRRGAWGFTADALYISFSDTYTVGPLATKFGISGWSLELSGTWQPASIDYITLLAGARQVTLDVDLDLTPGVSAGRQKTWADPIVGLQVRYPFADKWAVFGRADVGGFGAGSERMTNAWLGLAWNFGKHSSADFGYRYLALDFEDGGLVADVTARGYLVGLTYRF